MLPGAIRARARVFEELMARGLGAAEVETGFTPRRLVLVLKGLPAREADRRRPRSGRRCRRPSTPTGSRRRPPSASRSKCGVDGERAAA